MDERFDPSSEEEERLIEIGKYALQMYRNGWDWEQVLLACKHKFADEAA